VWVSHVLNVGFRGLVYNNVGFRGLIYNNINQVQGACIHILTRFRGLVYIY
jgi:hypothetical protein